MSKEKTTPWTQSTCNVPAWRNGIPNGYCGEIAYSHQYPAEYLLQTRGVINPPYCLGHACKAHGGAGIDEIRIFQDGLTDGGLPLWCAVMPDFLNLQETPAGFSGNPMKAVNNLREMASKEQTK